MKRRLVKLFLFSSGVLGTHYDIAVAQVIPNIVPDTTLGTENSIVAPNLPFTTRITGGATRSGNLFHSFQELSIGPNQTAWFDNPANIQSILVRVTGANRSDIDGTLRANGIADLFIINPNGVTFGQTAKLNIGGALSILTTPGIPLGDRGLFSASAPEQSQLLAIKPSALFDLARFQPQGDIIFKVNWEPKGPAINFVAKNITFDQAQINNPSGNELYKAANNNVSPIRINLQAAEGITIKDSNIGLYGGKFEAKAPGTIVLNNSRILSQSSFEEPAEAILFQGGKVEIINKSGITIPTTDDLARPDRRNSPVPLTIRSAGPILINSSRINQPVGERSLKPATFDGERDKATDRTNLAPLQIRLETPQDIRIQNSAIALRGGEFQAITLGTFSLEASQLYSDNFMAQAAAPITIQAENIRLDGYTRPRGQASQVGGQFDRGISSNSIIAGQAATINLTATNDLTIKGGQGIGSNTLTDANTGDIRLAAGNTYEMDSGGIGNQTRPNIAIDKSNQIRGNNGQIIINAKNIKLNKFGFNMDHFSQGGGGLVQMTADQRIDIGEGGIGTNAKGEAIGANILVKAKEVIMRPKSALSTSAEKQSQGGNIKVEADRFQLAGSISTSTKGQQKAGNIDIEAPQIILEEVRINRREVARGNIASFTGTSDEKERASGNSGDIRVSAIGPNAQVQLKSGAGIANTIFKNSTGNTGQIVVESAQLSIEGGSQIVVVTNSQGNAGLINVQARQLVKLVGTNNNGESPSGILSTIQTSAKGGSSKGIEINTPRLEINNGAGVISSTLGQGNSGEVKITAGQAIFSDKTAQGRSSGVLTSVGLGGIPEGELLLQVELVNPANGGGFSRTTLNPLVISKKDNPAATGNSGAISLNVGSLDILKGAQLVTAIVGDKAKAGDIAIQSKGNIRLLDRGAIRADSNSGEGGKIDIISDGILLLRRGGEISAVSRGDGKDVNIDITTPFIVGILNENSNIFAVSDAALKGGQRVGSDIKINATGILGFQYSKQFTEQNDILATGNVTLNLPDIDPSRGLTVLPTTPIDVAQKIDKSCNPDVAAQSSSFVTRGVGGLPASPTTSIGPNGFVRLAQVGNEKASVEISPKITTTPVEAQTSRRLANGRIRFQSNTQESISQNYRSDCLNRPDR